MNQSNDSDKDILFKKDNSDLQKDIIMVRNHMEEHYNTFGEIVGMEVTEELKNCIQSIIIKTNQYTELKLELVKRQLQNSIDNLPIEMRDEFK